MKYSLHQDDTGSFQELAHASGVEFGQLSLLTVAPRRTKGGHYHTHKKEWFCCIHGRCYIAVINVKTGKPRSITLDENSKKFVLVNSYESHIVLNPSDIECELLVICNEEYDPDNPDTVKYNDKGASV